MLAVGGGGVRVVGGVFSGRRVSEEVESAWEGEGWWGAAVWVWVWWGGEWVWDWEEGLRGSLVVVVVVVVAVR